ncbi:MAG TPA: MlaC/ttg2D family ABC transporter substrate-binding protein [Xylella sp.]
MKTTLFSIMLAYALPSVFPATTILAQASPTTAAASQGQATKMVIDSSMRILSTLEQRRPKFRQDPEALHQFMETEFNTLFDRDYAARLVLGKYARGASETDVKLFSDAIADNLMRRYGNTLLNFEGKPSFRAKSETQLPGNRNVNVRVSTELLRTGADPVAVDYLMRNVNGQWKIFDVMIEGISYVQTFRNQFDTPLRQKGITQVAADLRNGVLQIGKSSGK